MKFAQLPVSGYRYQLVETCLGPDGNSVINLGLRFQNSKHKFNMDINLSIRYASTSVRLQTL